MNKNNISAFMSDVLQNGYHFFDKDKSSIKDFYPEELMSIIRKSSNYGGKIKIEIGEIYTVRAFFAISELIDGEVEYQSGHIDLKLLIEKDDSYVGEVVTALPPQFPLKKGSKVILKKSNILYKPDYSSIRNK